MKPTLGSIVHYHSYGTKGGEFESECRAALVTAVHDADGGEVSLAVVNPTGILFNLASRAEDVFIPGTWHEVHEETG